MSKNIYIGVKLVEASPMKLGEWLKVKADLCPGPHDDDSDGYLVQHEDGYMTWHPRERFEKHNLQIRDKRLITYLDVMNLIVEKKTWHDEAKGNIPIVSAFKLLGGVEICEYVEPIQNLAKAQQKIEDKIENFLRLLLNFAKNGFISATCEWQVSDNSNITGEVSMSNEKEVIEMQEQTETIELNSVENEIIETDHPEMKNYISCKLIKARSMTRGEYNLYRGWIIPENENPNDEGFLCIGDDGHKNWYPKNVFENHNLQIENPNSISQFDVDMFLGKHEVMKIGEKTTLVRFMPKNGFEIIETSACVDPANYDEEIGVMICHEQADHKAYGFLGFLLQCAKYGFKVNS